MYSIYYTYILIETSYAGEEKKNEGVHVHVVDCSCELRTVFLGDAEFRPFRKNRCCAFLQRASFVPATLVLGATLERTAHVVAFVLQTSLQLGSASTGHGQR